MGLLQRQNCACCNWRERRYVTDPYTYSYDKNTQQTFYQKVIYPDNSYGFKEGSTFVPHFISTDGKYLIDYEIPENGNNPVIVLVER